MGTIEKTQNEPPSAEMFLPSKCDLKSLRKAAARCKGCELYRFGTQTVFGEGSSRASIVLVGEQPGDMEDKKGRPFVGPSGRLLHKALAEAGIAESTLYFTNAVKHFHWRKAGNRRLHQKPRLEHIQACRPWLLTELRTIQPGLILCLGAVAARSILGRTTTIRDVRGQLLDTALGFPTLITVHPSSILRVPDEIVRQKSYLDLIEDLRSAKSYAQSLPRKTG